MGRKSQNLKKTVEIVLSACYNIIRCGDVAQLEKYAEWVQQWYVTHLTGIWFAYHNRIWGISSAGRAQGSQS